MSMSDCERCDFTPCECGYDYRSYSVDKKMKLAAAVLGINESVLRDKLYNTSHYTIDIDKVTDLLTKMVVDDDSDFFHELLHYLGNVNKVIEMFLIDKWKYS